MLLQRLQSRLSELHEILAEHGWPTSFWRDAMEEADRIRREGLSARDIERFARDVLGGFGVGMGSLSDTYINDRFDAVREDVERLAGDVIATAQRERSTATDPLVMRRHLTAVETALLDAGNRDEAKCVRDLLNSDSATRADAERLASDLEQRMRPSPESALGTALRQLRDEMDRAG